MESDAQGLSILVDDAGAAYPITIDPTLTQSTSTVVSVGADGNDDLVAGSRFGEGVSGRGEGGLAQPEPRLDRPYAKRHALAPPPPEAPRAGPRNRGRQGARGR